MTQDFDPYHVWLGIPPDEQPPNHYRMLGLTLFEDSVEAIRDAATQRIAHVRTYQLGVYCDLSQRILNELAGAKACLSSPERKRQYDEQLRQGQTSPESDYFAVLATGSARPSALARRSSGSKHLMPTIGAGVAVVLLGLALAYLSRTSSPQVVVTPTTAERGKASVPPGPPASTPTAKPVEASKPELPEPAEEKKPVAPAKKEKPLPPSQEEKPALTKPPGPAVAVPSVPEPKRENRKPPVPDDAAQEEAKKTVADLFKEDFAQAKTPVAKRSLAKKLLQQGIDTPNDAAGRFVLFDTARELAVGANDGAVAFDVIDKTAEYFDVDAFAMKEETLAAFAKSARIPSAHQAIVEKPGDDAEGDGRERL